MIITILPSSANFHAIAYNEMKVEKGQATLLEVQNIDGLRPETYTADNLQWYFLQYSARNTYIKKPQFHIAVSCKGTEYSHQQQSTVLRNPRCRKSVARARNTLISNSST